MKNPLQPIILKGFGNNDFTEGTYTIQIKVHGTPICGLNAIELRHICSMLKKKNFISEIESGVYKYKI